MSASENSDSKGVEQSDAGQRPKQADNKGRRLIGLWRPPVGATPEEFDEWARRTAEEFVGRARNSQADADESDQ